MITFIQPTSGGVDCTVPPWIAPCPDPVKYLPIAPMAYLPEPDWPPRYMAASRGAGLLRPAEEL